MSTLIAACGFSLGLFFLAPGILRTAAEEHSFSAAVRHFSGRPFIKSAIERFEQRTGIRVKEEEVLALKAHWWEELD